MFGLHDDIDPEDRRTEHDGDEMVEEDEQDQRVIRRRHTSREGSDRDHERRAYKEQEAEEHDYQDSQEHEENEADRHSDYPEEDEEGQNEEPERQPDSSRSSRSKISTKSSKSVDQGDFVKKMKEILRKVFQFYASFGNRCNSRYLKPSQFIKMMLDADVVDSQLNQTKLDIMFLQACKKSKTLEFEEFLELLFIVAAKKFKKESNPDKTFRQLLVQYLQPLFTRILAETDVGIEDRILNSPLSVSTLLVLRMISKPLHIIYRHFFEWEINRPLQEKANISKVESELFIFLKEFEICPQLIAKPTAHSLFTQVLATKPEDLCRNPQYPDLERILGKDMGETFTFFRFVIYLSRLGIYIFSDLNNVPSTHKAVTFTVDEKIYLLLERLDISSGITKLLHLFQKERSANSTSSISQHRLSLTREALEHINNETGAYPHFFDSSHDDPKESRLSKILKANRQQKIGGTSGADSNKDKNNDEQEEFMYIRMAKRMSKNALQSRKSSSSISVSRKSSRRSVLSNLRANKENIVDIANKEHDAGEDQGPNLILPESYDTCETYLDELHKVFECYCSFGEPGNFTTMKSAKFMKLMKDSHILEGRDGSAPLEAQEIDLIFCAVLQGVDPFSNQTRKRAKAMLLKFKGDDNERSASPLRAKTANQGMGFSGFLQCLEAVAICTEKDLEKPIRLGHLIQKKLIPLLSQRRNHDGYAPNISKKLDNNEYFTGKLMSVLRDKTMVDILSVVHKTLLPVYQLYCDDNRLVNIKKFLQFMKDFGVFPQVISQAKLLQLYHELNSLYRNKNDVPDAKEACIDQHLFVEGLTLIALEVEYDKFKLTNAQKLILLLERMNDSDATQKLSRCLGRTISKKFDIVSHVRQKFAEHFKF